MTRVIRYIGKMCGIVTWLWIAGDNAAQFGIGIWIDLGEIEIKRKKRPVALCCIWRHEREESKKDDTSPDDTFATHIYSLFPFLPFIHGLSVFERKVTSAKKLREREREKVWARLLGHTAFSGNSYTQSNCRDDWRKV